MKSILLARFLKWSIADRITRDPDHRIGEPDDWYMLRWYIVPRNRWFNIYLHRILRSDDDRALHDHPWWSLSIMLAGGMKEITALAPDIFETRVIPVGTIIVRDTAMAHRLEVLDDVIATTLFITGPRIREWGFYCPQGWRHWKEFTAKDDSGQVGRGCE